MAIVNCLCGNGSFCSKGRFDCKACGFSAFKDYERDDDGEITDREMIWEIEDEIFDGMV